MLVVVVVVVAVGGGGGIGGIYDEKNRVAIVFGM